MPSSSDLVSRVAACPPELGKLCGGLVSNPHPRASWPWACSSHPGPTSGHPLFVFIIKQPTAGASNPRPWPTCTTQTQLVQLSAPLWFTCFSFWYSKSYKVTNLCFCWNMDFQWKTNFMSQLPSPIQGALVHDTYINILPRSPPPKLSNDTYIKILPRSLPPKLSTDIAYHACELVNDFAGDQARSC